MQSYYLILRGTTVNTPDELMLLKAELAKRMQLTDAAVASMFNQLPAVLKTGLEKERAELFISVLTKLGAQVECIPEATCELPLLELSLEDELQLSPNISADELDQIDQSIKELSDLLDSELTGSAKADPTSTAAADLSLATEPESVLSGGELSFETDMPSQVVQQSQAAQPSPVTTNPLSAKPSPSAIPSPPISSKSETRGQLQPVSGDTAIEFDLGDEPPVQTDQPVQTDPKVTQQAPDYVTTGTNPGRGHTAPPTTDAQPTAPTDKKLISSATDPATVPAASTGVITVNPAAVVAEQKRDTNTAQAKITHKVVADDQQGNGQRAKEVDTAEEEHLETPEPNPRFGWRGTIPRSAWATAAVISVVVLVGALDPFKILEDESGRSKLVSKENIAKLLEKQKEPASLKGGHNAENKNEESSSPGGAAGSIGTTAITSGATTSGAITSRPQPTSTVSSKVATTAGASASGWRKSGEYPWGTVTLSLKVSGSNIEQASLEIRGKQPPRLSIEQLAQGQTPQPWLRQLLAPDLDVSPIEQTDDPTLKSFQAKSSARTYVESHRGGRRIAAEVHILFELDEQAKVITARWSLQRSAEGSRTQVGTPAAVSAADPGNTSAEPTTGALTLTPEGDSFVISAAGELLLTNTQ